MCSYNFIVIDFSSCYCVCLICLLTVYTWSKLYFSSKFFANRDAGSGIGIS